MLSGNNSILNMAGEAKEQTEIGREKEDISLVYMSLIDKEVINGEKITDLLFEEELNKNGDDTIVGYDNEDNYLVFFNDTKHTYKVDKYGNTIFLENAPSLVTEIIYVILYNDGTMTFSNNNLTDSTKTITKTYTISKDDYYDTQDMVPWNNETSSVKKVIFVDEIRPSSTKRWFKNCLNITAIENLENLNTNQVVDMSYMFCGCRKLTSLDLSSFDTKRVRDMKMMFSGIVDDGSQYGNMGDGMGLTTLNISSFDTRNVTSMGSMFSGCKKIISLDLSNFNTSNTIYMNGMFDRCEKLNSLDLSNFNTSKVINMGSMFSGCKNLISLDISNFDTSNVKNMSYMFTNCKKIKVLDLSSFDTHKVEATTGMFVGWENNTGLPLDLETIYAGDLWDMSAVIDDWHMFIWCNDLVGGKGTEYKKTWKYDKTYARIDGGPTSSTPGYLTYKNAK